MESTEWQAFRYRGPPAVFEPRFYRDARGFIARDMAENLPCGSPLQTTSGIATHVVGSPVLNS
jgi:hypothetical protein